MKMKICKKNYNPYLGFFPCRCDKIVDLKELRKSGLLWVRVQSIVLGKACHVQQDAAVTVSPQSVITKLPFFFYGLGSSPKDLCCPYSGWVHPHQVTQTRNH